MSNKGRKAVNKAMRERNKLNKFCSYDTPSFHRRFSTLRAETGLMGFAAIALSGLHQTVTRRLRSPATDLESLDALFTDELPTLPVNFNGPLPEFIKGEFIQEGNQCDGCQRGLVVDAKGIHRGATNADDQFCTGERYL